MNLALLTQAFSCWWMTGVIWLVQILVYPGFSLLATQEFRVFHDFHTRRITWVVAPAMGLELASAAWLLWRQPGILFLLNFISVVALWLFTGLVSVPFHNLLGRGSEGAKELLVRSNWFRTVIWSLRSLFWLWLLCGKLKGGL